ncbi:MAG: hypothetical protein H6559_34495 [Lewinellaceae bacterium]|nr:hypothetical protein [Lewinellaceae bacterium]
MEAPDFFILLVLDPALVKKGSIARISDHIDEKIDLSKYGDAVKGITYSPTISEKMPERHRTNKNKYLRKRKEWFLTIDLDFAKAIRMVPTWNTTSTYCRPARMPGAVRGR